MKRNNIIALMSLSVTIIIWVIEIINPSVKLFLAAVLLTAARVFDRSLHKSKMFHVKQIL